MPVEIAVSPKKVKRTRPPRCKPNSTPAASTATPGGFERQELHLDDLKAILARARTEVLGEEDASQIEAAVETLALLTAELEAKGTTIARLRRMLFGPSSEKSRNVLPKADVGSPVDDGPAASEGEGQAPWQASTEGEEASESDALSSTALDKSTQGKAKGKRSGHGRRAADAYVGAERVEVPHPTLAHKDPCPVEGCEGKVYVQKKSRTLVRVVGVAPLIAKVYALQTLRCNLCGQSFTAPSPEGVGEAKYDETASTMMGLLRYGCGLPMHRLEGLGEQLGMPMPAGTQWEVLKAAAELLEPVWQELVREVAQGEVLHIDDTKAMILDLHAELRKALAEGEGKRVGMFTTGVVSRKAGRDIALFMTGAQHAGENLQKVLALRLQELAAPIAMSDALAQNSCGEFEALLANCLTHGRRNFVDLSTAFPEEVEHVLESLKAVYVHDAHCRDVEMTSAERLAYHVTHSQPVMEELYQWMQAQLDDKLFEPNSSLGKAIAYMTKHKAKLTLFLRVAGAPLDNNIVERALKRAIIHRKNSLFYKTETGAHVGDVFMSLIYTCEGCGVNPFEYLVAIQRHAEAVKQDPAPWMPWNFRQTLDALSGTR